MACPSESIVCNQTFNAEGVGLKKPTDINLINVSVDLQDLSGLDWCLWCGEVGVFAAGQDCANGRCVSYIQEVKDHLPGFDVLIFKHFFSADQRLCCPQAVVM